MFLARLERFELSTGNLEGFCSIQLSYSRIKNTHEPFQFLLRNSPNPAQEKFTRLKELASRQSFQTQTLGITHHKIDNSFGDILPIFFRSFLANIYTNNSLTTHKEAPVYYPYHHILNQSRMP